MSARCRLVQQNRQRSPTNPRTHKAQAEPEGSACEIKAGTPDFEATGRIYLQDHHLQTATAGDNLGFCDIRLQNLFPSTRPNTKPIGQTLRDTTGIAWNRKLSTTPRADTAQQHPNLNCSWRGNVGGLVCLCHHTTNPLLRTRSLFAPPSLFLTYNLEPPSQPSHHKLGDGLGARKAQPWSLLVNRSSTPTTSAEGNQS